MKYQSIDRRQLRTLGLRERPSMVRNDPVNVSSAPPHAASFERAAEFERSTSYRLTLIALLLWWIASLYPLMALLNIDTEAATEAAQDTAQGSLTNQLIRISFTILGGLYLPSAMRALRTRREIRLLLCPLGAYLLWSSATILWSVDVALSIRRLGELVLLLIGVFGLGAGFYSRTRERALTCARHALYAGWIAVAVLTVTRLWNHSFSEMLDPEWSLKGNTAGEYYIFPLAYGVIAALAVYPFGKMKQLVSLSLLSLALLILKGRFMIVGTLAVGLLIACRLSKSAIWRTIGFVVGLILLAMQVDWATGGRIFISSLSFISDTSSLLLHYLTTGRGMDDLLSLDGRVPLWQVLWPYFAQHPFVGYGFGAFWNPTRFGEIYAGVLWPAVAAHNGFLDELLGTGSVGLLLFLAFWFCAMRANLRVARTDMRARYLVFGWLLLFLCFNSLGSIMQMYFTSPTLFALTGLFALLAQPTNHRIKPQSPTLGNLSLPHSRIKPWLR